MNKLRLMLKKAIVTSMKSITDDLDHKWGRVFSVIGVLLTLVVIAGQLIVSFPYSGKGFNYFIVFLMIIISLFMFILLFLLFEKPLRIICQKRREEKRLSRLTEQQFPVFEELVDRFKEIIEPNRSDNIPYIVQKFSGVQVLPTSKIHDFFSIYEECMRNFNKSWTKFYLSIKYFEWILSLYNDYCICIPIGSIGKLETKYDEEKKRNKKEYEKYKRKYVFFIDDYIKFAKRMNSEFSTRRFREYFDEPEDF